MSRVVSFSDCAGWCGQKVSHAASGKGGKQAHPSCRGSGVCNLPGDRNIGNVPFDSAFLLLRIPPTEMLSIH